MEPSGITAGFRMWPYISVLLPAIAPRMIATGAQYSNEKNSVLRFCNNRPCCIAAGAGGHNGVPPHSVACPMRHYSLTLALILAPATIPGLADEGALKRCRAIADSASRLACYDGIPVASTPALVAPQAAPQAPPRASAPVVPPPAAPPSNQALEGKFGLEQRTPAAELPSIQSHIPGVFEGWRPNSLIRLANGQVWQIADDSSLMLERRDPKVTVRRGMLGAFYLDFEGDNRSPKVRRIR